MMKGIAFVAQRKHITRPNPEGSQSNEILEGCSDNRIQSTIVLLTAYQAGSLRSAAYF